MLPVSTLFVVSLSHPSRSVSDQYRLSGAWFHCHGSARRDPLGAISSGCGASVVSGRPFSDRSSTVKSMRCVSGAAEGVAVHGVSTKIRIDDRLCDAGTVKLPEIVAHCPRV